MSDHREGRCLNCGKIVKANIFTSGNYYIPKFCSRICSGLNHTPKNYYHNKVKRLYKDKFQILSSGRLLIDTINIRCKECYTTYEISYRALIERNFSCKKCYPPRRKSHNRYLFELFKSQGDKYEPLEEYKGSNKPILHRCNTCNYEWKTNPFNMKKYGCPACSWDKKKPYSGEIKEIWFGNKLYRVQGYEYIVLNILKSRYKPKNILIKTEEGKPVLKQGRLVYIPDFYYTKKNRIIEVKSFYTLGIKDTRLFRINRRKAKMSINKGYEFDLMLINKLGERVPLMNNWYNMTRKQFVKTYYKEIQKDGQSTKNLCS